MCTEERWGLAQVAPEEIVVYARRAAKSAASWGMNPNDVESEVAYRLLIAAQRYSYDSFLRVVHTVARNAIISLHRRRVARREISLEEAGYDSD